MPREKPDFFKTFSVYIGLLPPVWLGLVSALMQSKAIHDAVKGLLKIWLAGPQQMQPADIGSVLPSVMILGRLVATPLMLISILLVPILARILAGYQGKVITVVLTLAYFAATMSFLWAIS